MDVTCHETYENANTWNLRAGLVDAGHSRATDNCKTIETNNQDEYNYNPSIVKTFLTHGTEHHVRLITIAFRHPLNTFVWAFNHFFNACCCTVLKLYISVQQKSLMRLLIESSESKRYTALQLRLKHRTFALRFEKMNYVRKFSFLRKD